MSAARRAASGAAYRAGGGGGPSPAAFPSRLTASGGGFVDENSYTLPPMLGFNTHPVPWSQTLMDRIAALTTGPQLQRIVVRWQSLQPTDGTSVSSSAVTAIDDQIARAQATGKIYSMLELHLNVSDAIPSWVNAKTTPTTNAHTGTTYSGYDDTDKFYRHGQYLTQYLANRYGNPSSPQYTKAVIGFGLNEPPITGNSAITNYSGSGSSVTYLVSRQQTIFGWMRAAGYAPDWIAIVALAYAQQTPLYDGVGENTSAVKLQPGDFTNWALDYHDYFGYDKGFVDDSPMTWWINPARSGRQFNGFDYAEGNGGPAVSPGANPPYKTSQARRDQQQARLAPYRTFCQTNGVPLLIGEWGATSSQRGELSAIEDKRRSYTYAGAAAVLQWIFNVAVDDSGDPWAAMPGGGPFRPSTSKLFRSEPDTVQVVEDQFSGSTGAALTSRTGELGATWTVLPTLGDMTISSAGRAYASSSGEKWVYASGQPLDPDQDVAVDFWVHSAIGEVGFGAASDTSAKTGLRVRYVASSGTWAIDDVVAGSVTTLGTHSSRAMATGKRIDAILLRRADNVKLVVSGIEVLSVTSTASLGTRPFVWANGAATDTTGVHIDSLIAVNAYGAALAHVKNGGTMTTKTPAGATHSVTVPAGGHAKDNLLVVFASPVPGTQTINSVTDTRGNPYMAVNATNRIWVTRLETALQAGDTVTVTLSGTPTTMGVVTEEFSGFWVREDVAGVSTSGTSTSPSANITTALQRTLALALVRVQGPIGDSFTQDSDTDLGAGWTGRRVGTTGGGTDGTWNVAWKITRTAGTITHNPTLGTSRAWNVFLAALRPL